MAATQQLIAKMPSVSGPGREPGKVYVSQEVDRALTHAEQAAERMGDEYISVEHLLLALIEQPDSALKSLFKSFNVDK